MTKVEPKKSEIFDLNALINFIHITGLIHELLVNL